MELILSIYGKFKLLFIKGNESTDFKVYERIG
jgi:hypothetical protein